MPEKLFEPLQLGGNGIKLGHRIAMAPLTRFRAEKSHTASEMAIEYYRQRASTPGTLLITEGTFISIQAGGYNHVPGIWDPEEQTRAWKKIVDEVHARGSFIYMQLWALGRAGTPRVLAKEPGGPYPYVSSSNIGLPVGPKGETPQPHELSQEEIEQYIKWYAEAARNFVHGAGGDGVEIHGANGYIVDQFTQSTCNKRTDKWGGSVENRCRFAREVVSAVCEAVGPERTGIRLSPHNDFQGMKMDPQDLHDTFSYLVSALKADQPQLSYLHMTQPRVAEHFNPQENAGESIDPFLAIWSPKPVILAGGYTVDQAEADVKKYKNCAIAFGRYFISNPDLPEKIRKGQEFTRYNRKTFYLQGPQAAEGYTSYGDPLAPQRQQAKM